MTSFFVLVGKLHKVQQLFHALFGCLLVEPIHAAHKTEILGSGEPAKQRHPLGHNADLALQVERRGVEWHAVNLDCAGARLKQAGKHFDSGGLARAIRPQKAEELARSNTERYIVHGGECAEAPRQAMCLNRRSFHFRQE